MGRSHVEIRSQTIIAKRTLVRAMINADSLKTNRQAMEDLMRLLLEDLESGAATAIGNSSQPSHQSQHAQVEQPAESSHPARAQPGAATAADSNGAAQHDGQNYGFNNQSAADTGPKSEAQQRPGPAAGAHSLAADQSDNNLQQKPPDPRGDHSDMLCTGITLYAGKTSLGC